MGKGSQTIAKLSRPRLHAPLLRERLFELGDWRRDHPVLWVSGPAGSGKTTLIASYLEARGAPVFWYQIDPLDADPATLFFYLSQLARQANAQRKRPLPYLTAEYLADLPGFTRRFFRDFFHRLPQGATLVFDNCHEAGSPFGGILREALREIPQGVFVTCISRAQRPIELTRLTVTGALMEIGWDDLQLTAEESAAITLASGVAETSLAANLHRISGGWIAGLTLTLARARRGGFTSTQLDLESREAIFHYFAGELFEQAPAEYRRLLIRTALLTRFTADMAIEASGDPAAPRLLDELYRRHYFTGRSGEPHLTYHFHDLFREFLIEKARQTLSTDEYRDVLLRSAALLQAAGQGDDAFALHCQAADWDSATRAVLQGAEQLLRQGRWQTVLHRIARLPGERTTRNAWLLFWQGLATAAADPARGRAVLELAFAAFVADADSPAQMRCCSATMDTFFQEWNAVGALDRWIAEMERLLGDADISTANESAHVRSRALSSMVVALVYRQPTHPLLPVYADEVLACLATTGDVSERIAASAYLIHYFYVVGAYSRASEVVAMTEPDVRRTDLLPVNAFMWWDRRGHYHYVLGDLQQARMCFANALRIASDNGLIDSECLARLGVGTVEIGANNLAQAATQLDILRPKLNPARHMHTICYYWLKLWRALNADDLAAANDVWQTFSRVPLVGVPIHTAYNHPVIDLLVRNGKHSEALSRVQASQSWVAAMGSVTMDFNLLLMEAHVRLASGDEEVGANCVARAFEMGRRHDVQSTLAWIPAMMSNICAVALDHGIETDYTRRLIRIHRLQPPSSESLNWPRPLKVITLGRFAILRDERPLEFSRKTPRRLIALLKAIVVSGPEGVSAERLYDWLWPDHEGDAAHEALATALHRLRKLLDLPEAVRLIDSRVSLDPSLCWVDAFVFERMCEQRSPSAQAFELYRGAFLPFDRDEPWAMSMRERLRGAVRSPCVRSGQQP